MLPSGTRVCSACNNSLPAEANLDYEYQTVVCSDETNTQVRYKCFYERCGWQVTDMRVKEDLAVSYSVETKKDRVNTGRHLPQKKTHIIMQRDKNMPNYNLISQKSAFAEAHFLAKPPAKCIKSGATAAIITSFVLGLALTIAGAVLGFLFSGFIDGFNSRFGITLGFPFIILGAIFMLAAIIITAIFLQRKRRALKWYRFNQGTADAALNYCHELLLQNSVSTLIGNDYKGRPWL